MVIVVLMTLLREKSFTNILYEAREGIIGCV